MANLRKITNKHGATYYIDFYFEGRRHVISTKSSSAKIAKKIKADIEAKIAFGTFKLDIYQKKEIRLSEFVAKYKEKVGSTKSSSTIARERIVLDRFIQIVGNPGLKSVDAEMLAGWRAKRLENVKPVTFNIELRTMKAIFGVAESWEYIEKNPFKKIGKLRVEEHRLYMTEGELARFFNTLRRLQLRTKSKTYKQKLQLLAHFYYFLYSTGLRRDEALCLRISDVDFDINFAHIRKAKDKEARAVPLTKEARKILLSLGTRLFQDLKPMDVSHQFKKIADMASLEGFKLHSLRHTFATKLISAGVDVLTVSKILGHSDINTTMIYAKVRLATMQNAIDLFKDDKTLVKIWLDNAESGGENENSFPVIP